MQRPSQDNLHAAVFGELEHHAVVDKVQGTVQRTHGQICRPVELDLGGRQGARAGQRPPGGPVVLMTNQGSNQAKFVDHANGVAVRNVDLPIGPNGNSWKVEKSYLKTYCMYLFIHTVFQLRTYMLLHSAQWTRK